MFNEILQATIHRSFSSFLIDESIFYLDISNYSSTKIEKNFQSLVEILSSQISENSVYHHWITFHTSPIILLRNADHLLPDYIGEECLYARCEDEISLFSIKTTSLQKFSDYFSKSHEEFSNVESALKNSVSKLKGKPFEKGEVAIASYPNINWKEITNAAIVCAPGWPEKECAEFMQSLFFGRYLGDETGLFLNILHPCSHTHLHE